VKPEEPDGCSLAFVGGGDDDRGSGDEVQMMRSDLEYDFNAPAGRVEGLGERAPLAM